MEGMIYGGITIITIGLISCAVGYYQLKQSEKRLKETLKKNEK